MDPSTEEGSMRGRHASSDARPRKATAVVRPADGAPQEWLRRTIETEIVPRLMLAHAPEASRAPSPASDSLDRIGPEDVAAFTHHVLRDDVDACSAFVAALRERGVPLDRVYLELIAPAARRLGTLWEDDDCDFAQVTLGLWRLQSLVFETCPLLPTELSGRGEEPPRALLVAAPGSQHTLGLLMVSEFFRRAGWEVWSDPVATAGDIAALVRSEWFDLVGLSVGIDAHVQPVGSVILALRRASRNPAIGVMVGGPVLAERPNLVDEVGADFSAADARQAVERADGYLAVRLAAT